LKINSLFQSQELESASLSIELDLLIPFPANISHLRPSGAIVTPDIITAKLNVSKLTASSVVAIKFAR